MSCTAPHRHRARTGRPRPPYCVYPRLVFVYLYRAIDTARRTRSSVLSEVVRCDERADTRSIRNTIGNTRQAHRASWCGGCYYGTRLEAGSHFLRRLREGEGGFVLRTTRRSESSDRADPGVRRRVQTVGDGTPCWTRARGPRRCTRAPATRDRTRTGRAPELATHSSTYHGTCRS